DHPLAVRGDLRVHLVEEAHRVDRLDVLIDGALVERAPLLRLEVHPDGVLFHPEVALDAHARTGLCGALAAEHAREARAAATPPRVRLVLLRHGSRRHDERRDQHEWPPAPPPHHRDTPPRPDHPTPRRGAGPAAAGSIRPATRRSVRSIAAASRSLW